MLNDSRARATVTTPTIFRDFRHLSSNRVYHGGNSEYNNPVELADLERKLIWPDTEHSPPDILISVGAGYDISIKRPRRRSNNWRSKSKSSDRVLLDPVQSSSDAQDTWDHYHDSLLIKPRDESRYIRLNPLVDCAMPKLDDVDEMADYRKEIKKVLRGHTLTNYAQQIIASCFFFDIIQPPTEGENRTLVCKGLYCNLYMNLCGLLLMRHQARSSVDLLTSTSAASANTSTKLEMGTISISQFKRETPGMMLWNFSSLGL